MLTSSSWCNLVIGALNGNFDLDSPLSDARSRSHKDLLEQVDWASHLSLPSIVIPAPKTSNCANYAKTVAGLVFSRSTMRFTCRIPITSNEPGVDSWVTWSRIRSFCDCNVNLSVTLELTPDLPSDDELQRWLAEPVSSVIFPEQTFVRTKSGKLSLGAKHRQFVLELLKRQVRVVLSGFSPSASEDGLDFIHQLYTQQCTWSEKESFESPYYDYLQSPLQPLADHLENQTYETFEKDPIKYEQYEKAIFKALVDRKAARPDGEHLVLFVLGAGRGPLVKCALRASRESGQKLKIYALDKNPNAVITLRHLHKALNWGDVVTIVDADMREWRAPEKADIIVSELLGSFGDNELSPECLDGAQTCACYAPDGISIPKSTTSFLAPVSCVKAWNEVRSYNNKKSFETSYVVKLHQAMELDKPQPCFSFVHPNPEHPNQDNTRYAHLKFTARVAEEIHGMVGYFECPLYADVMVSINPETHTPEMTSWFPMYFPIPAPLFVQKGETIDVHMWRCMDATKVWYEWCIATPSQVTPVLNPNGRSYFIRLF